MRALVVYESMFGNTRAIAEAVAGGLSDFAQVETVEVGQAPPVTDEFGLLVVGGPTHAFGMSRPSTRADAVKRIGHGVISEKRGVREWLSALPAAHSGQLAATFDTRIGRPRMPGSAAHGAAKRLRGLGYAEAAEAASFWVDATEGPLYAGEVDRARQWGAMLGAGLVVTGSSR